jgi:hypothetical protein
VALPCCGKLRFGGSESQDDVINALRAENHDLKSQVAAKDGRIRELESKVAGPIDLNALRALPVVASIGIDRLSGWEAKRSPEAKPSAVVYLRTLDGDERFVQVAGSVQVRITASGTGATLAEASYTPDQVRAAFRSGFTGTFYVFRVPAPASLAEGFTIEVSLSDAVTGKAHAATRTVAPGESVKRPALSGKQGV